MKDKQQLIFKRFHLWIVVLVALVFSLMGIFFFISQKDLALSSHRQNSQEMIRSAMASMRIWLDHNHAMLHTVSQEKDIIDATLYPEKPEVLQRAHTVLLKQHRHLPYIMNMPLVAVLPEKESFKIRLKGKSLQIKDGDVFLDTIGGKATPINLSALDYIKAIKAGKDYYIGKPYLSLAIQKPIFVFSRAVKVRGKLTGILIMGVRLDYFTELFIEPLKIAENGYLTILDQSRKILAHPQKDWIYNDLLPQDAKRSIEKSISGEKEFYGELNGEERYYISEVFHYPHMEPWYFAVSYSKQELFKRSYQTLYVSIGVILLLSGIMIFLYHILSKRFIQKPLRELAEKTSHEYEAQIQAIFQNSFQLTGLLDKEGHLIAVNKTALNLIGVAEETVLGRYFWECPWWSHDPTEQSRLRDAFSRSLAGEFVRYETNHFSVDGERRCIDFTLKPIQDEEGRIIMLLPEGRDITEKRRQENIIREQEAELALLIETSPLAMLIVDNEMNIQKMNGAFTRLFGYDKNEVRNIDDWWHLAYPDPLYRKKLQKLWEKLSRQAVENGSIIQPTEVKAACKDGAVRIIEVMMSSSGKSNFVIFNDLSELKEKEAELSRLADVFLNIQMGIYVYHLENVDDDHSLRMIAANPASEALTGAKVENIVGKTLDENFPGLRDKGIPQLYARVVRDKKHQEIEDLYYDGPYGVAAAFAIRVFPLPSDCVGVTFDDITQIKKNMLELERTKSYLNNVVNSMPSLLVGIDQDGKITEMNWEAEKATGLKNKEVIGRSFSEIFPAYQKYFKEIGDTIQKREIFEKQKIWHSDDESQKCLNLSVYPLITNGISGAVVRLDDVTDQVRLEEMMIQTEKMLSVGGLAAGMAHEINNPLGIITQGIQNSLRRLSPELQQNLAAAAECGVTLEQIRAYLEKRKIINYLHGMNEAVGRASQIVTNMLNFTRTGTTQYQDCDLNKLLYNTLELAGKDYDIKRKYDFKKIAIETNLDDALSLIHCNASQMEQVFLNIVKNAAQAMVDPEGNPKLHQTGYVPKITINTKEDGTNVIVSIEDNGPGMEENVRKRVFEPFFTTKEVGQGTGLGLSVSYFILTENHGGKIEVDSQKGQGTKFIITLPLNHW